MPNPGCCLFLKHNNAVVYILSMATLEELSSYNRDPMALKAIYYIYYPVLYRKFHDPLPTR